MNPSRKVHLHIFFLLSALTCLLFLSGATVQAQTSTPSAQATNQTSPDDGLHVDITPYIWFAGVSGTAGVLGHDAAVHASFGDIFDNLNIGAMGVLETRYNRVLIPVDFLWMKLSDDKGLPVNDLGVQSIKAKMTETMLAPKIGYRLVDGKRVKVDALFGVRYWHVSTELEAEPTQPAGTFSDSANWVDAIAGGRVQVFLTPKAFAAVVGDAGGGSARSDYQVGGFVGYQISRKCALLVGYRYMSVNYRPNTTAQFVYDVNMPGLMLGVTINLK